MMSKACETLLSAHMVAYSDASKPFILTYDGSDEAVSVVLVQTGDKGVYMAYTALLEKYY